MICGCCLYRQIINPIANPSNNNSKTITDQPKCFLRSTQGKIKTIPISEIITKKQLLKLFPK